MDEIEQDPEGVASGFSYRTSKDGKLLIEWRGRLVTIVRGREAERLLARMAALDEPGVQQVLARATGNFKRGNERLAKQKRPRDV